MAITQVHRRLTHRDQAMADIVFFGAVPGATVAAAVGLPIAAGAVRTIGTAAAAGFGWFRRTNVAPYTYFRES